MNNNFKELEKLNIEGRLRSKDETKKKINANSGIELWTALLNGRSVFSSQTANHRYTLNTIGKTMMQKVVLDLHDWCVGPCFYCCSRIFSLMSTPSGEKSLFWSLFCASTSNRQHSRQLFHHLE